MCATNTYSNTDIATNRNSECNNDPKPNTTNRGFPNSYTDANYYFVRRRVCYPDPNRGTTGNPNANQRAGNWPNRGDSAKRQELLSQ
jgi:hypothetical protein